MAETAAAATTTTTKSTSDKNIVTFPALSWLTSSALGHGQQIRDGTCWPFQRWATADISVWSLGHGRAIDSFVSAFRSAFSPDWWIATRRTNQWEYIDYIGPQRVHRVVPCGPTAKSRHANRPFRVVFLFVSKVSPRDLSPVTPPQWFLDSAALRLCVCVCVFFGAFPEPIK